MPEKEKGRVTSKEIETTEMEEDAPPKRKAVDDAFERLFGYPWGTAFGLDENSMAEPAVQQLVQIFGMTRTARIVGSRGGHTYKRQRLPEPATTTLSSSTTDDDILANYKNIPLPKSNVATVTETKVFAGQTIQTKKVTKAASKSVKATKSPPAAPSKKAGIDSILAQLNGPAKMSTVQKTSNDWESFKESDKQLQDELEKNAQGKDAFLVKQDFLNRVDQRKFELEKDERDRERAKRATT